MLHEAASWDQLEVVKILLDHGAKIDIQDNDSRYAFNQYWILTNHTNVFCHKIQNTLKNLFYKGLGRIS